MNMQHDIVRLQVQKTRDADDLPLPRYMTAGSSGMDLYAAVENEISIDPGEIALIPTGLMVAVPRGYEIQIRPRSGLAAHHGLGVLNSPGTIDSDYRGEIKVILFNFGKETFCVKRGDRIAQMILAAVALILMEETDQLPPTTRSDGGFGHTGQ